MLNRCRQLSPILAALILALLGTIAFVSTSVDDAYFSFWPAYSLATFGKLLNYNGQRIEQNSSLLHSLILALLYRVAGSPIPILAWALSLASAIATCFLLYRLGCLVLPNGTHYAPLLLATSPYFIYWSVSTLETTLASFCVTFFILACSCFLIGISGTMWVWFAAFMLVSIRPELGLVGLAALFLLAGGALSRLAAEKLETNRIIARKAMAVFFIVLLFLGILTLFRVAYFGRPFPEPVFAKIGGHWQQRMQRGLSYLREYGGWSPVVGYAIIASGFLGLAAAFRRVPKDGPDRGARMLSALFLLIFLTFVVLSGADWMEAGRFFVPVLPLFVLFTLFPWVIANRRKTTFWVTVAMCVFHLYGLVYFAHISPLTSRGRLALNYHKVLNFYKVELPESERYAWVERISRGHLRDIPICQVLDAIIPVLHKKDGPIQILSHQGGMVFYYMCQKYHGRVRVIDGTGLSTRHLAEAFDIDQIRSFRTWNNFGIAIPYEEYFKRAASPEIADRLPVPDIIFDFSLPYASFAESLPERGYAFVFKSKGSIPGFRFERDYGPVDMFVAVRKDLLPEGQARTRIVNWNVRSTE